MNIKERLYQRFSDLFTGNEQTFGYWNPINSKVHTKKRAAKIEDFNAHLDGDHGIGRVPIMDNGTCHWAAIDIDSHNGEVVSVDIIAKDIFAKGLPLVPCRSKSGGVHCYLFTSEPVPAALIKRVLSGWARDIGHEGSEIFPKQKELRDNMTGNWINLPYFDESCTIRYAVEVKEGVAKKLGLAGFLDYAESCRLTVAMLRSFVLSGHEQAPPCLQELMIEGVPRGVRNEALYAFTIYLKKKLPSASYRQEILKINETVFDRPLPLSEANRSIQSASRSEYRYKCMEEPCRSLCDSKVCLTRDYGIEPSDAFDTGRGMPQFTRLRVINTEPPMWEITVEETPVMVQTKTLRNFQYLAEEIMDKLYIVIPLMKQKDWMPILSDLMLNLEHIDAPDNASVSGIIRERLIEFIDRADFNSNGKDPDDKELIIRGLPVIQERYLEEGKREVLFRGTDFISYLKRTRSEELKGNALWMALRTMGMTHRRTRINGKVVNLWSLPVDGAGLTKLDMEYDPNKVFIHSNPKNVVKIVSKLNF